MNNIQNIISAEYSLNDFQNEVLKSVFQNRTADFQLYESSENEEINESEERIVSQIAKYGYLETTDGTSIDFYEVRLQPNVLIERNRVTVGNIIRRLMYGNSAAFVNFVYAEDHHPDWRFTFIHKAEVFDEAKDDFVKHETEAKRYTYLLGPNESCRTAADRLQTLSRKDEIRIEDIEQAFSVEALSKEFFEKYKQHYEKFVDYITTSQSLLSHFYDSDREKQARDFVKKLMGRIVFLYFIQKKGWLGVAENKEWGTGNQNFMSDLFNNSEQDSLFYVNYLEPLFFETLNKKRDNDICTINGKTLGRVPFLNGGLFEREFKNGHLLTFPADYFKHLFSFFDSYNFTIIENDPQNRNVAVDPEMLGHIFENLLEDNKDKGAYYTPKEIVHYMCQESIIEYLNTKLSENSELSESCRTNLEQFIKHKRDNDFVRQNAETINTALREVKVCDPAIGSGAFPVGLLMEIYTAKQALQEISGKVNGQTAAEIKQHIIQNSIYGVDIERGAVDIARLRFWLSLIIEETEPQALPNLDYKIMQGNSLVPMYEGEVLEIDWTDDTAKHGAFGQQVATEIKNLLNKIIDKQRKFFDPKTTDKYKVKAEIRNLKIDLLTKQLDLMIATKGIDRVQSTAKGKALKKQTELLLQTENWKRLKQKLTKHKDTDKPLNYFDWKLDFADVLNTQIAKQTGFDIVIGNPPYVKVQNLDNTFVSILKSIYSSTTNKFDLYVVFIELIFNILNKNGIASYINPHRFIRADYGTGIKNILTENFGLNKIVNFGTDQVFENVTTYSGIFFFSFNNQNTLYGKSYNKDLNLIHFTKIPYKNIAENWLLTTDKLTISIFEKIYTNSLRLDKIMEGIYQGFITVGDDIFILKGKIIDDTFFGFSKELNQDVQIESSILKPVLKGENIVRYEVPNTNIFCIYPHYIDNKGKTKPFEEKYFKDNYPSAYEYMLNFKDYLIKKKKSYKTNPQYWFSLHRSRELRIFQQEKLITPQLQNKPSFVFDDNKFFPDAGGYMLIPSNKATYSYFVYLAILNSKVLYFFIKNTSTPYSGDYYYFKTRYLENFRIPLNIDAEILKRLETNVNQILALKKTGKDTTDLEREIDQMVYELYGLTNEEIQIVEESVKK